MTSTVGMPERLEFLTWLDGGSLVTTSIRMGQGKGNDPMLADQIYVVLKHDRRTDQVQIATIGSQTEGTWKVARRYLTELDTQKVDLTTAIRNAIPA